MWSCTEGAHRLNVTNAAHRSCTSNAIQRFAYTNARCSAVQRGSIRSLLKQMDGLRVDCVKQPLPRARDIAPEAEVALKLIQSMHLVKCLSCPKETRGYLSKFDCALGRIEILHLSILICKYDAKDVTRANDCVLPHTIETPLCVYAQFDRYEVSKARVYSVHWICPAQHAFTLSFWRLWRVMYEKVKSLISSVSLVWISSRCALHV